MNTLNNTTVNNKTALITGAAQGMGLAFSQELAKRGYNLFLTDINNGKLEYQSKLLKKQHQSIKVDTFYLDLATENAANILFNKTSALKINISLLVNNAGIFFFKDIALTNSNLIDKIINLHIITVTKLCYLYANEMKKSAEGGNIINMSSICVHTPFPGITLYSATKSYIRNFTKAYSLELIEYGIKMSVVCPGAVATDLYKLSSNLKKLGVTLGIIMPPKKLVKIALNKNAKGKIEIIPGILNKLFKPCFALIPKFIKLKIRKKIAVFTKNFA